MAKAVILVVDDDPAVLGAIERDLRQQYRADYRVMKAGSPPRDSRPPRSSRRATRRSRSFSSTSGCPACPGTELLREVMKLHPPSRKVLLTAYADTDVAIAGINEVALDHYLMKPWDPPEQRLYPVLDDLLAEWRARVRPDVRRDSRRSARNGRRSRSTTKEFLSRNRVPYQWVDLDADAPARALAESLAGDLDPPPDRALPGRHAPRRADDDRAGVEGRHADAGATCPSTT